ncbi:MAG: thioesterase domain-containing protein [Limisphaerales bacterium]
MPVSLPDTSFGGLLAFEVAHQLQREGRRVEMILLLDSWPVFPPWWRRLKTLSLARAQTSLKFRAGHLWWKIKRRVSHTIGQKFPVSTPAVDEHNHPFSKVPSEVPWELLEKIYRNAMKKYRLRRLDSRAILFRARDSDQAHLYKIDETLGWKGFFERGFEMVETSGDHFFAAALATCGHRSLTGLKSILTSRKLESPAANPAEACAAHVQELVCVTSDFSRHQPDGLCANARSSWTGEARESPKNEVAQRRQTGF